MQQDSPDFDVLTDQLLATPEEHWPAALDNHAARLSLALVAALKRRSDALNRANPPQAEQITRAANAVANRLREREPLAYYLARWARGNWAVYTQPAEAVTCYLEALEAYSRANDVKATGRIWSNLVLAYTNLGSIAEATSAAERAQDLLTTCGPDGETFLVDFAVNYGWLLYERGHYAEALAANEQAMPLAIRHKKYMQWAELRVNQAFTLIMVGRLSESEELLLDSRETLVGLGQHLTVARIDLNLADLASSQGRPAMSLRRLRQAREAFEALGVEMETASVLLFEADLLVRLGAFGQALRAYEQARTRFTAEEMQHYAAIALLAAASVRRSIDWEDGLIEGMLAEASDIFARRNLDQWRAEADLEHAALAVDRGNLAGAEEFLALPLLPQRQPAAQQGVACE